MLARRIRTAQVPGEKWGNIIVQQVAATLAGIQGYINSSLARKRDPGRADSAARDPDETPTGIPLIAGRDDSNATPRQLYLMRT